MNKCTHCGKEYPDGVAVCDLDGHPLIDANAPKPLLGTKPEQKQQTDQPKFVERINQERIAFCALWGIALIVSFAMGGLPSDAKTFDTSTPPAVLFLVSAMIVATYVIGSLALGFITFKDRIPEQVVREHPELMRFSWPRFFREGIYSVGFLIVIALGILIAATYRRLIGK
jgi:hypothetical protein